MSVAADTREAVRQRPFLLSALRAGVLNYAAAADFLDLDADREAVAAALRRYAADLPDYATGERNATVRMRRGVRLVDVASASDAETEAAVDTDDGGADAASEVDDSVSGTNADDSVSDTNADDSVSDMEAVVTAGGQHVVADGGQLTAVLARGDVDAATLHAVLGRLDAEDVYVDAAGLVGDELVVVVPSRDGAAALRIVEGTLEAVPA